MSDAAPHDQSIPDELLRGAPAPSGPGCADCESVGGWWFHLRRCVECGHIGCCDDSLAQHGRRHFEASGHRYIRSFEPGEVWFWDFGDELAVRGAALPDPQHHPLDQSVPGPADRLPADWQAQLIQAQVERYGPPS